MSSDTAAPPIGHKTVLALALPIVLSNVSEPLIGIVDTAVIGQLGAAHLIGAVALGGIIFAFAFWAFGFLRMGTTGLTAQASGARNPDEIRAVLARAGGVALIAGLGLIVLQAPIATLSFWLIEGSDKAEAAARDYFDIRIWSAPFALANYTMLGWFIGLGRTMIAFTLQLVLNLTNIALDALLVLWLGMGVEGVALGTLLAEVIAALAGLAFVAGELRRLGGIWSWPRMASIPAIRAMMSMNGDLLIRSVSLLGAFAWFVAQGARSGDVVLAANAILINFFLVSAYFLDGFAFAAETLVGRMIGAVNRAGLDHAVRISSLWALLLSLIAALVLWIFGDGFIRIMTVNAEVRLQAGAYLFWVALTPLTGVACFQLDGIYTGATRTADMRNMMLVSLAAYLLVSWALMPRYGNHGLWLALHVFFIMRGITLALRYPALVRAHFH